MTEAELQLLIEGAELTIQAAISLGQRISALVDAQKLTDAKKTELKSRIDAAIASAAKTPGS